jgi:hypothetical protein
MSPLNETTHKEMVAYEHLDRADMQEALARVANQDDHDIGKLESIRKFPLAFLWSLYAVWCVLLVSFENHRRAQVPKGFRQCFCWGPCHPGELAECFPGSTRGIVSPPPNKYVSLS